MNLLVGVLLLASVERFIEPYGTKDLESARSQVSLVTNHVFNRTSNIYLPEIRGGLIVIDLEKLVNDEAELNELISLYDELQAKDTFFGSKKKTSTLEGFINNQWVKIVDNGDGTYTHGTTRWRGVQTRQTSVESDGPYIMRLDQWIALSSSTINGGLYYRLRGVPGTLGETVAKFAGADAAKKVLRQTALLREVSKIKGTKSIFELAAVKDELSKTKALIGHSNVTGRQRLVIFLTGSAMPLARGVQVIAITLDLAEDNEDPNSDPNRNLLRYETYNGGEMILHLSNGCLLYYIFDANDNTIGDVPGNVASDREAYKALPNVSTTRVFAWLSCANCHDSKPRNWGWQPVDNIMAKALRGNATYLSQNPQELASSYGATREELDYMLDTHARIPYQKSITRATGAKSSDLIVKPTALQYWNYWYQPITAQIAASDVGVKLTQEEAVQFFLKQAEFIGLETFEEDIIITQMVNGEPITPAQWRVLYPKVKKRVTDAKLVDPVPDTDPDQ